MLSDQVKEQINRELKKYPADQKQSAVMAALIIAQDEKGWLSTETMQIVGMFVPHEHKPVAMLCAVYFVTMLLTEILSNNAAGAIMATLGIEIAEAMGVSARPFLIAVTIAASASFATPIGYQANTYIYGVGGYRFSDFVKVGVPLNIIAMVTALFAIVEFFPF